MIEVFKTDVQKPRDASRVKKILQQGFPGCQVSFDLEDCDKVLRMAGGSIEHERVIGLLRLAGFACQVLE